MSSMPSPLPSAPFLGNQRPRLLSAPPSALSEGARVRKLAASAGLVLDPWQEYVLDVGLGRRDDRMWAAFEVALIVSRQNGKGSILEALELAALFLDDFGAELILHSAHEFKCLTVSVPILTANRGWTTMGELTDADEVFGPDGQPTKLTAHPVLHGRRCWRIRFADGQEITADGDHLWAVSEVDRGGAARQRVVTTDEIREAGLVHHWPRPRGRDRRVYRWRVALAAPPDLAPQEFPVAPWLFGYWLGDGNSRDGRLTVGEADLPYVLSMLDQYGERYSVTEDKRTNGRVRCVRVQGLTTRLRLLGALGGKRIPDVYLRGSIEQRQALLAGVMDSDGTVSAHQIAVTMSKPDLMEDVVCLVRSLGYRATLREFRARLNGKDAGPMWRVQFAAAGTSPFWLPRKNEKIRRLRAGRSQYNAIVAVEPVPSEPVRCITVTHESGCYLAGRGFLVTHNTAAEAFLRIRALISDNPLFERRVERIRTGAGSEAIELKNGKRLRFIARSKGSGRGFSADLVILDEAYNLGSDAMAALLPTLSTRPNPQVWYTSSAGTEMSTQLARVRQRGVGGRDPSLAFFEWSVDEDDHDPADPAAWALANPGLGIRISPEYVERERAALDADAFARERLGVGMYPVDPADAWLVISRALWESRAWPDAPRPKPRPVVVADASPGQVSASVGVAGWLPDGRVLVEIPEGDHRPGVGWVVPRLLEMKRHRPAAFVIDPRGPAAGLIPEAEKAGLEIVKPALGESAQAFAQFYAGICEGDGTIAHLGQPELATALAGATSTDTGDGGKLWARKDTSVDISPLVACTLAHWAAVKFSRVSYDLLRSVAGPT